VIRLGACNLAWDVLRADGHYATQTRVYSDSGELIPTRWVKVQAPRNGFIYPESAFGSSNWLGNDEEETGIGEYADHPRRHIEGHPWYDTGCVDVASPAALVNGFTQAVKTNPLGRPNCCKRIVQFGGVSFGTGAPKCGFLPKGSAEQYRITLTGVVGTSPFNNQFCTRMNGSWIATRVNQDPETAGACIWETEGFYFTGGPPNPPQKWQMSWVNSPRRLRITFTPPIAGVPSWTWPTDWEGVDITGFSAAVSVAPCNYFFAFWIIEPIIDLPAGLIRAHPGGVSWGGYAE
jgi:hypothetical protein